MALMLDQNMLDMAKSLTLAEIPTKLRCATCNELAVNAFKLPCCDQSICQTCQSSLPEACPVCDHSPLDADTCKPNKSLRLTIRAFLKSEEKKRAKDAAEAAPAPLATPSVPEPTAAPALPIEANEQDSGLVASHGATNTEEGEQQQIRAADTSLQNDGVDAAQQGEELAENANSSAPNAQPPSQGDVTPEDIVGETVVKTTEGEDATLHENNGQDTEPFDRQVVQQETATPNAGFAVDQSQQQHALQGMDWNSNAGHNNPLMMQNTMQSAGWGAFPAVMGMPGMNMNQMNMPQNMFGGFGMDMNDMSGMNMGMSFGGGFGGGWNGQQGMGGNFGNGYYPNGGYNQHQMQHQGPYGAQMQHQQFPNHNYQNRYQSQAQHRGGYGRGRGGSGGFGGRGGYSNQYQGPAHNQMANGQYGTPQPEDAAYSHQVPHHAQDRRQSQVSSTDRQRPEALTALPVDDTNTAFVHDAHAGESANVNGEHQSAEETDQQDHDVAIHDGNDHATATATDARQLGEGMVGVEGMATDIDVQNDHAGHVMDSNVIVDGFDSVQDMPTVGTLDQDMAQAFTGPHGIPGPMGHDQNFYAPNQHMQPHPGRGRGGFGRGGFRGRGGYGQMQGRYGDEIGSAQLNKDFTVLTGPIEAPPIDAPKGPKAMRDGLPNSGIYSRPGYAAAPQAKAQSTMVEHGSERNKSLVREPSERVRSASRSRSRSSSRHRKRKHRQRSQSATSQDSEARERRRERRRRHEKRYADERRDEHINGDMSSIKERPRSSSPEDDSSRRQRRKEKEKHRSSRSHRDRSKESRRHRHRSNSPRAEEYANGTEGASSDSRRKDHGHGHRDRDRDKDHEKEREREREHDKERDKKRSRRPRSPAELDQSDDRRHDSSRRSRHTKDGRNDYPREEIAPAADDIGFKIKGSRSAAMKTAPAPAIPTASFAPPTGPRKDRNRDREPARQSSTQIEQPSAPPPAAPAIDPHAQEREERNRERMLREQQRRESATLGKRSRGSIDEASKLANFDPPTGPRGDKDRGGKRRGEAAGASKSRRVSYKYEDDEGDEARASRVESEREAGRWR